MYVPGKEGQRQLPCIQAWQMNIHSLKVIWKYVQGAGMSYLITYRLTKMPLKTSPSSMPRTFRMIGLIATGSRLPTGTCLYSQYSSWVLCQTVRKMLTISFLTSTSSPIWQLCDRWSHVCKQSASTSRAQWSPPCSNTCHTWRSLQYPRGWWCRYDTGPSRYQRVGVSQLVSCQAHDGEGKWVSGVSVVPDCTLSLNVCSVRWKSLN